MYQDTSDTVPSYHDLQTLMKWRHITKSVFAKCTLCHRVSNLLKRPEVKTTYVESC